MALRKFPDKLWRRDEYRNCTTQTYREYLRLAQKRGFVNSSSNPAAQVLYYIDNEKDNIPRKPEKLLDISKTIMNHDRIEYYPTSQLGHKMILGLIRSKVEPLGFYLNHTGDYSGHHFVLVDYIINGNNNLDSDRFISDNPGVVQMAINSEKSRISYESLTEEQRSYIKPESFDEDDKDEENDNSDDDLHNFDSWEF